MAEDKRRQKGMNENLAETYEDPPQFDILPESAVNSLSREKKASTKETTTKKTTNICTNKTTTKKAVSKPVKQSKPVGTKFPNKSRSAAKKISTKTDPAKKTIKKK